MIVTVTGRRTPTVNAVYGRMSKWERAAEVKWWRQMAWTEALKARRLLRWGGAPVQIIATPLARNRQHLQDVAACLPAVKACIDGLVDARLIPSDGPDVVVRLIFEAPRIGDVDGLELRIEAL